MMFRQVTRRGLFASKSDDQTAADVGMIGVTGNRASQHLMFDAVILQCASGRVGCRKNTVNIGPAFHSFGVESLGDFVAYCRTTIDRRNDRNVIARADATIGPMKSLECSLQFLPAPRAVRSC